MIKFRALLHKPVVTLTRFQWLTYVFFPITFILVLRNGINFWGYDKYALEWVKVWPNPASVFSVENAGNLFLAKILGVESRFSWMLLHIFLAITFL